MKMHTTKIQEQAIAIGVVSGRSQRRTTDEHLDELVRLADTAGVEVRHRIIQEREHVDSATYIGSGKAVEIGRLAGDEKISTVIFDDDLSAVQIRNLEKIIPCKIIDRSGLILDIFASRAKTKEAMTQVELAQLQYLLPRLTRQWTHLSKQYGGVGTKGPGETQIETDRRAIRTRIRHLREKLQSISNEREIQRKRRKEMMRVAMVGYTNAGKSTLLRHLSGADVLVEDRLFATLDTTVRMVIIPPSKKILISDTVGFIRKLPPHLIASFRSTLAEVAEADILLHVIDTSHPQFSEQIAVVNETLDELQALGKPTIYVFNKIDKLEDRSMIGDIAKTYSPAVFISAERGINIGSLEKELLDLLERNVNEHIITIKQSEYGTIAKLHEFAEIIETEYEHNSVRVRFRINNKNLEQLKKLLGKKIKLS
jgi:GTP-binding protein HflX